MVGREGLEPPETQRSPDLQSGALPITRYLPIMMTLTGFEPVTPPWKGGDLDRLSKAPLSNSHIELFTVGRVFPSSLVRSRNLLAYQLSSLILHKTDTDIT